MKILFEKLFPLFFLPLLIQQPACSGVNACGSHEGFSDKFCLASSIDSILNILKPQ